MDGGSGRRCPGRELAQHEVGKPQQQAGEGHHDHTPPERQVFNFLDVADAGTVDGLLAQTDVVLESFDELTQITKIGHHLQHTAAGFAVDRQVDDMNCQGQADNDRRNAVYQATEVRAGGDQGPGPPRVGITEGKTAPYQYRKAEHDQAVGDAEAGNHAHATAGGGRGHGANCRLAALADEIQPHVNQHAADGAVD